MSSIAHLSGHHSPPFLLITQLVREAYEIKLLVYSRTFPCSWGHLLNKDCARVGGHRYLNSPFYSHKRETWSPTKHFIFPLSPVWFGDKQIMKVSRSLPEGENGHLSVPSCWAEVSELASRE